MRLYVVKNHKLDKRFLFTYETRLPKTYIKNGALKLI